MKALSVRQPWADLIIAGVKSPENRTRGTRYRGPLLIHAGKQYAPPSSGVVHAWYTWQEHCNPESDIEVHGTLDCDTMHFDVDGRVTAAPRRLPYLGGLIGVVELVDCLGLHDYITKYGDDDFATGPICLRLERPRRFTQPILLRGKLGLFDVDDDLVNEALHG